MSGDTDMTRLRLIAACIALGAATTSCAVPAAEAEQATPRAAYPPETTVKPYVAPTTTTAEWQPLRASPVVTVPTFTPIDCVDAIKVLAFVGDPDAVDLWNYVGQDGVALWAVCQDALDSQRIPTIRMIRRAWDIQALGNQRPAPLYSPPEQSSGEDLDCEDIGEEVWVGNDDPNNLDGDGDGWGCEGW